MPERPEGIDAHAFQDPALLRRALVHRSADHPEDNERLEFLGDAVVGLVVAEELLQRAGPDVGEGPLTRARAQVVRREGLAAAARDLDLGERLVLGEGERRAGGADKDRILCGAFEALVGAVFLDGGYQSAREFCLQSLSTAVREALEKAPLRDPKSELQELTQEHGQGLPRYQLLEQEGEPHRPRFRVRVEVGCVAASGEGGSKKEAEREAARGALEILRRHPGMLPHQSRGENS